MASSTSLLGVGLVAPHAGHAASSEALQQAGHGAEEIGLSSLWVGDHIVLPENQVTPYPYRGENDERGDYLVSPDNQFYEAFQSLAYLAAFTSKVKLGLSVGILPYRHPLLWAKSLGTLSALSDGRVIFGAGTGWLREEFEALSVDFSTRGLATDRVLKSLRALWEHPKWIVQLDDAAPPVRVVPAFSGARPPIWVGGTGQRALRRVAEYGDVWHPMLRDCPPTKVAESKARLEDSRGADTPVALYATLVLQPRPSDEAPWESNELRGPASHCAELLHRYAEAGVTDVVLSTGGSIGRRLDTVKTLLDSLQ